MIQTFKSENDWLAHRKSHITGTDLAAIMGESPFMTPFSVWVSKTEGLKVEQNNAMRMGTILEPAILDVWESERNTKLTRPGKLNFADNGKILGASLDGYADAIVVDAKNLRKDPGEKIPTHYYLQLLAQMHGTDKELGELACLIGGQEFKTYEVQRDKSLENSVIEFCERWWDEHIVKGVQPQIDGSDSATKWIKEKFAKADNSRVLEPTEEIKLVASRLSSINFQMKELATAKEEHENKIRLFMGDAIEIKDLCTWKNNKDKTEIDWEAVAKEMKATPEVIARFTTTKPGARVLRLKQEK